ncbi:hypothetical protein [Streptomyces omiyaensis]
MPLRIPPPHDPDTCPHCRSVRTHPVHQRLRRKLRQAPLPRPRQAT